MIRGVKKLFSISAGRKAAKSSEEAVEMLFSFIEGVVNDRGIIEPILKKIDGLRHLPFEERMLASVRSVFILEDLILKNRPPVVKKAYTKESFRREIADRVNVSLLPDVFRLIFLDKIAQALCLYEVFLNDYAKYALKNLGIEKTRLILLGEPLAKTLKVTDKGLDFSEFNSRIYENERVNLEGVTDIFRALYAVFYIAIKKEQDDKRADELNEKIFKKVRDSYDYEIISGFLEVLPGGEAENQRLTFLTREQLAGEVKQRTLDIALEKQKVDEKVKQRTKQLEEEKNKLDFITENMLEGAILFNSAMKVVFVNKKCREILSLDANDNVENDILDAYARIFPEYPIADSFEKVSHGKMYVVPEVDFGDRRIFRLSFAALYDTKDEKANYLIWIEDITEVKQLDRRKSEFISVVAHQLRTPLSGLKWTIHMIASGDLGPLSADQKIFLEKCYDSNERMITLVNDMLGANRIESGKFQYNFLKIDAKKILNGVLFDMRQEGARKNIKIQFESESGDVPQVYVDPDKIRQVMQNLIENSIKYTIKDGFIKINMKKKENFMEISVRDTGIGIPKDQQKNIFTRFFRGKNAVAMETDGTGLGLFIVKNLVEKHGGKVWFESEENKGSTFYFTLPVAE